MDGNLTTYDNKLNKQIDQPNYKGLISEPTADKFWAYIELMDGKVELLRKYRGIWDELKTGLIDANPDYAEHECKYNTEVSKTGDQETREDDEQWKSRKTEDNKSSDD